MNQDGFWRHPVGCAIPADKKAYGYISEHHSFGQTERQAGDYAEDLAAAMLASTLGIDFNIDESWDEKKRSSRSVEKLSAPELDAVQHCEKTGFTTVFSGGSLCF